MALGAPAQAAGSPPVTKPDSVKVVGGYASVRVLANDSDPDGDKLAVCRVDQPQRHRQLRVDILEDELILSASPRAHGTFKITYYACDFSTLVPGTLTVTVKKSPKLRLQVRKIANRPGKLRVTNKSTHRVDFVWGAFAGIESFTPDGVLSIGKKKSKIITVRRSAIFWLAVSERFATSKVGETRGIKLPRGTKALPPSTPLSAFGLRQSQLTKNLMESAKRTLAAN